MALARIQYEADGSTSTFSLPFPYIGKEDIHVSLSGTETTAFSFLDGSTVKLDVTPTSGTIVDIVRRTASTNLLVEFNDGSTLLETDLMLAAEQTFYLSQEAIDQTGSSLTVAEDGSYSASSRRITLLGYPSDAGDAANKQYVNDIFAQGEDAYDMALEAKHWANHPENTLVPEGDGVDDYSALHHRLKSAYAQTQAETARNKAQSWSENAVDVEVEVGKYSAYHHRTKAETAQSLSESARDKSNLWAEEAIDVEVEVGQYSAYHHSQKASGFASNSASSANSASNSASQSAAYRTESQNWATAAEDTLVPEGDGVADYSALHWSRKAEGWAQSMNLPTATGNGGQVLRQTFSETGLEYVDPKVAAGITVSATEPSSPNTNDIWLDIS